MKFKIIVEKLIEKNKTISTMESCTGGLLASNLIDIEGASKIIKFSAVTYSNEFKIKMGVSKKIIDNYSVYSIQTAEEMSKSISKFTNSNYGIGITGKLNRVDKNNLFNKNNIVYISIYDKDNNKYYNYNIEVNKKTRKENKIYVVEFVCNKLIDII